MLILNVIKKIHTNKKGNDTLYTEKYQKYVCCSFAYKVVCVDDKFSKSIVLYRRKNVFYKIIETILEE